MISTRLATRSVRSCFRVGTTQLPIKYSKRFVRTQSASAVKDKARYSNPKYNKSTKASVLTGASSLALFLSYFFSGDDTNTVSVKEVKSHNRIDDCWIVIDGDVYDITGFLSKHPGGVTRLMEFAGRDATERFHQMHSSAMLEKMKEHLTYIGKLKGAFDEELSEEDIRIMEQKSKIPSLSKVFCISDFEAIAKQVLPKSTFFYYATGSSMNLRYGRTTMRIVGFSSDPRPYRILMK